MLLGDNNLFLKESPFLEKGEYKGDLQFAINQSDMIEDGIIRMALLILVFLCVLES